METYKNQTAPKGFVLPSLKEMIHSSISTKDYKSSPITKHSLFKTPKQGIEKRLPIRAAASDIGTTFHTPPQSASLMKTTPMLPGVGICTLDNRNNEFSVNSFPKPLGNPISFPLPIPPPFGYNEEPSFNVISQNSYNLNRSPLTVEQNQLTPETFYSNRDFQVWEMNPKHALPQQNQPLHCRSIQHTIPHRNHNINTSSIHSLPQEQIIPYQPNTRTIIINCDGSLNQNKDARIRELPYQYVGDYGHRTALQNYYSPPVAPPLLSQNSSPSFNVCPIQSQLAPPSYANLYNNLPSFKQDYESTVEPRAKINRKNCLERKVIDLNSQEIGNFKSKTKNKYPCSICKKPFNRYDALKTHMNMHLGLKPFRCGICAKRFNAKQNMLRHERNHSPK